MKSRSLGGNQGAEPCSQGTSALVSPRSQNASPSDAGAHTLHALHKLGVCACQQPLPRDPCCPQRLSPLQPQLRSPLTSSCCGSFCQSLPCRPAAPTAVAAVPCVCTEVLSERHSVTAYRQVPPLQQDVKFTTRNTAVITASSARRRVLPGSRQTWSMSECVNGCQLRKLKIGPEHTQIETPHVSRFLNYTKRHTRNCEEPRCHSRNKFFQKDQVLSGCWSANRFRHSRRNCQVCTCSNVYCFYTHKMWIGNYRIAPGPAQQTPHCPGARCRRARPPGPLAAVTDQPQAEAEKGPGPSG